MKYGDLIRQAREAAGLSQTDLADMAQIDRSVLSRIEASKVFVEPDVFRRLCASLRALSPVALVNALGYEVTTPGADRLPSQLVRDLLRMPLEDLEATARLVHRAVAADRPEAERTQ